MGKIRTDIKVTNRGNIYDSNSELRAIQKTVITVKGSIFKTKTFEETLG